MSGHVYVWERGAGDVVWASWSELVRLASYVPIMNGGRRHGRDVTAYRRPDGECIAIAWNERGDELAKRRFPNESAACLAAQRWACTGRFSPRHKVGK